MFRIYTESQKLNVKEASQLFNKWDTELNRQFLKKNKWPKISGERVPIHHGNGNESWWRSVLLLSELARIANNKQQRCWWDWGEGHSHVPGIGSLCSHYGNGYSQKIQNKNTTPIWARYTTSGYMPQSVWVSISQRYFHSHAYYLTIHNSWELEPAQIDDHLKTNG